MLFPERTVYLKDKTPCLLRSPQKSDAPSAITYLKAVTGQSPFLLRYPQEVTFTIEEEEALFERFNQSPTDLFLLAFIHDSLAAICIFSSRHLIKVGHRANLAISIDQKYWGFGLGTQLINSLCEKAKEIGIVQMELEYIEGNARGKALYEKCGFIQYGRRPNSIRLDDGTLLDEILMLKDLT